MKIYTGYYGNMKAYRGMACVAISLSIPKWLTVQLPNCRELNPKPYMLHMDKEPYTAAYNRILDSLSPQDIVAFLERVSDGKDVVLLCFEKPGDFCHRQLVAEWLNKNLQLDVREYAKSEPPKPKIVQPELF